MTFSIVAKDAQDGAMGVAVQSHYLAVGARVPWGMAGVGVVATQATAAPQYGSKGLELMAAGSSAAEALQICIGNDDTPETRQVGMLDAAGRTAAHTGAGCWRLNAHARRQGAAAQANMVASTAIPAEMLEAFEGTAGDFAGRLLAALDAAQTLGGDLRGQQSAALLIVAGERMDHPEDGILIDLRVDDDLEALKELRRIYDAHQAVTLMLPAMRGPACRGPIQAAAGELQCAITAFESAQRLYGPDNLEPTFWHAVALFRAGHVDEAARLLAHLRGMNLGWATLFDHVTNP